jgi:rhomboid protease GluP
MSEHNAIGNRVETRPAWRVFLLLLITGGLYRTYWAWRTSTDLAAFARERENVVPRTRAIRVNPSANAFWTLLMLPGSSLLLYGLMLWFGSVPAEYGVPDPTDEDAAWLLGIGIALLVPALLATIRTNRRIAAARTLAGLAPTTRWTRGPFVVLLALDAIGVPAPVFAMQQSLDDLWGRFPPLLDEDLHGELAPEPLRDAAIERRPELHELRLEHVAQELERPGVRPIVTVAFAAVCVVAFIWQLWFHGPFPDTTDIEAAGGLREGLDGMWWRFWTANVLHVSVQHLTGNLLVWALIATLLERVVGHARMVGLIIFGAAGCSAGALIAHPDIVGVGASGVVFAAFGMAAMIDPLARRAVGKLGWSLVAFGLGLSTFAPGVSSGGHVGGVLAGFVIGAVVMLVWRVRRPLVTAGDRAARRTPVLDRHAPLAPDREQTIAERLAHLDRRREAGALAPEEHERLRRALVTRG